MKPQASPQVNTSREPQTAAQDDDDGAAAGDRITLPEVALMPADVVPHTAFAASVLLGKGPKR